jgi:hypothetical protein
MGSVPNWRLCQAPSDEPDTAHEVGVMPLRTAVTAMRVGRNGQGLSYLEETPIHVAMAWRFLEDAEGRRHNWWRLEVKSEPRDVASDRATSWSKKGTLERADAADISFASVEEAAEWVGALNHDYWEKGCCLTAGISQPEIPFDPLEPVRNVQRSGLFVFGICEHLKEAERGLLRDVAIERLLEATERGTLRFWAPGAKLASVPTLLDEVKDDRWSLMGLSIRQALAGPHRHGARWIGHPVAEKVAQIYREHVNRRNRRLTEERARLAQLDEEARAVGPAQTHDTRMFH